ncbi:MAG: CHAT domain-containing protein [Bacteroidia bacterium]|nr:CHAT domain-containing protein [Bacteroidia bacterium]
MNILLRPLYVILFYFLIFSFGRENNNRNSQAGDHISVNKSKWSITLDRYITKGQCDSASACLDSTYRECEKSGNWSIFEETIIKLINCYRNGDYYDKSKLLLQQAKQIAFIHLKSELHIKADLLFEEGSILMDEDNYQKAIAILLQSVDTRLKINNDRDSLMAYSFNNIAYCYLKTREFKLAIEYYSKAIQIRRAIKPVEDLELADYYQNLGIANWHLRKYDNAIQWINRSMKIKESANSTQFLQMINLYVMAGIIYKDLGLLDNSLENYNKAEKLAISKNSFSQDRLKLIYANKGWLYYLIGDKLKALQYFNNAVKYLISEKKIDYYNLVDILKQVGIIYMDNMEYNKALNSFKDEVIMTKKYNFPLLPEIYQEIANCHFKLGNIELANKYYQLALSTKLDVKNYDFLKLAMLFEDYGNFYLETRHTDECTNLLFKSKEILLSKLGNKDRNTSTAYSYISKYYSKTGQTITALEYCQKAIISLVDGFDESDIFKSPGTEKTHYDYLLAAALKDKADLFDSLYEKSPDIILLRHSLKNYQLSIRLIEKLRTGYLTEESKFDISRTRKGTFLNAMKVADMLYHLTGNNSYRDISFEIAERSKSAVLLTSIRENEAIGFSGIPDTLQSREKDLKIRKAYLNNLIYNENANEKDKAKIEDWQKKIFEIDNQYDKLILNFEKNYPQFYSLKYTNKVLGIHDIQTKLKDDQTIIEYTLSDSVLYAFVCESKNYNLVKIPIDSTFYTNLDSTIKRISFTDILRLNSKSYAAFVHSNYMLYSKLILPIRKLIHSKELVIIPDDKLSYLPFEALITDTITVRKFNFRSMAYLIYDYTISYSYSATLMLNNPIRSYSTNKMVAFEPCYNNFGSLDSAHIRPIKAFKDYLSDLPYTKAEINFIQKISNGLIFQDYKATEDNFKASAKDAGILHLAMHSYIDNEDPMYSKLVFTQSNTGKEDGLLNTYELYNMELHAKLAVLSACNTGFGKLEKGEGVMSFARGFLFAGCKSILMTMWTVEDRSGYLLTAGFYKGLYAGKEVNIALREAKLDYLKKSDAIRAHPYFWAAYVNIGSTDKVFTPWNNWYLISGIVIFCVLVLFAVRIVMARRKIKKVKLHRNFTFPINNRYY